MKLKKRILSFFLTAGFLFGALTPAGTSAYAAEHTSIVNPKCEYMTEPLGIDVTTPRFSWEMTSGTRGQKQTAYQVLVASTEENADAGTGDIWNSGKVTSDRSVGVEYDGPALQSKTRYYWKVLVWDKDGNGLESGTTWFETGLLDQASDWTAKFISSLSSGTSAPMFRKEFTVNPEKTLAFARLYSSAMGVYEAYINGEKVGVDKLAPGWTDYNKYVQYQTFDVTDMLADGENAIGAIVGNGWYSGHVSCPPGNVNKYGVDVAFIGQLELTYTDGSTETTATDDTWKSTKDGPYLETDNQDGETYDARKEMPGWDSSGYDDSAWSGTVIATADSIDTKVDIENIELIAQIGEPVAVTEELPVKEVTEPSDGVYIFDLGQNMVGWARLKVTGDAGTTVKLRFGEMLQKNGTLYTANLRTAEVTDYYTLKGDPAGEVYEPCFTFHGFRYVEVTGYPGVPTADDITGVVVGSDIERTGYYETSNALINQLYSNIIWGQRGNYLSIPTDCPQRDERCGWTGDAQAFVRTGSLNFNIDQFFKKYLMDVETAQRADGAVFDFAPAQGHTINIDYGNAGWADAAVICPWTIYTTYGDTEIIRDNYQMMKSWVDYCKSYAMSRSSGKLIIPDCDYGDWLSIGESTPKNVVATAYFAYSTDLFSRMARVIGEDEDAATYEALFEDIRGDFNDKFVSSDGTVSGNSQTAYLLALKMNLLPTEELRQKAAAKLIGRIEANDWHLTTGFLGVSCLCPVLSEMGYSDIAYQLLLTETYPSWLYSVVNGATTIWERWNSYIAETGTFGDSGMNSFNHYSYGSVGEWMYRYSAGIEYDEDNPGYKHIIIQPNPSDELTYVNGSYDSVYGMIESNWTMDDGAFALDVKIPANTTATVYLPSDVADSVKVDGAAYTLDTGNTSVEGVTYVGEEDGKEIFEIESGSYTFASEIASYILSIDSGDEYIMGQVEVNGTVFDLPYTETYTKGKIITVEAVPVNNNEYSFSSWSGDDTSGTNPITVTMDGDKSLTANFSYMGETNLALGKTVTSKSNDGAAPVWSRSNLTDGLYISTGMMDEGIKGFTSTYYSTQDVSSSPEWIEIDLGSDIAFNEIHLYPRTDAVTSSGTTAGFPIDFTLSVKKDGESDYTTVYTGTDYTAPYRVPAVLDIGGQTARYVRLTATTLGDMASDDSFYRLQMAEIGVYNITNILTNPSFETTEGWTMSSSTSRSSEQAHSGNYSLKIYGNCVNANTTVAIKEDTDYILSGWIYKTSDTGNAYLDLNDISGEPSIGVFGEGGTGTWTFVRAVWNSGSNTSIKIRCVGDGGISSSNPAYFDDISLAVKDDSIVPTVSNGTIISGNVTQTGVALSWNKATDNKSAQGALQYLVYRSDSDNIDTVANIEDNGTAIGGYTSDIAAKEITGLSPNTTYYFNVIVKDKAGNKSCYTMTSATTEGTVSDETAPTVTNGTIGSGDITSSGLTLSWNKATDNESAQGALQYLVYRSNSDNIDTVTNIEANGTVIGSYDSDIATKEITGLGAGTTYYFNVIVKDKAGNKSCYTMTSVKTEEASVNQAVLSVDPVTVLGDDRTVTFRLSVNKLQGVWVMEGLIKIADTENFEFADITSLFDGENAVFVRNTDYSGDKTTAYFSLSRAGGFEDAEAMDAVDITVRLKDGKTADSLEAVLDSITMYFGNVDTHTSVEVGCSIKEGVAVTSIQMPGDLFGDVNGDGILSEDDFDRAVNFFGLTNQDDGWSDGGSRADLNTDGMINIIDLTIEAYLVFVSG